MFGLRSGPSARRTLIVCAIAVCAALLGAGVASADVSVDKTLQWNGTFPIIGNLDPINTEIITTLPSPVVAGTPGSASFTVKVDAPSLATTGLDDVNAATLQGTADAYVYLTDPNGTKATIDVPLTIPSTPTPAAGSDLVFTATGSVKFPGPFDTGTATVAIDPDHLFTTLDPKQADGSDTVLGTFTVQLNLDQTTPAQDPTLGQVQVVASS